MTVTIECPGGGSQFASTTGDIGGQSVNECVSACWVGHCVVHAYSPVVLLCSVLI